MLLLLKFLFRTYSHFKLNIKNMLCKSPIAGIFHFHQMYTNNIAIFAFQHNPFRLCQMARSAAAPKTASTQSWSHKSGQPVRVLIQPRREYHYIKVLKLSAVLHVHPRQNTIHPARNPPCHLVRLVFKVKMSYSILSYFETMNLLPAKTSEGYCPNKDKEPESALQTPLSVPNQILNWYSCLTFPFNINAFHYNNGNSFLNPAW